MVAGGTTTSFVTDGQGGLFAFGSHGNGRLGIGGVLQVSEPRLVAGGFRATTTPSGAATLAAGFGFVIAIRTDGSLWSWGDNTSGQLGDGTFTSRGTPVKVGDNYQVVSAGASFAVGIKVDNSLWVWGSGNPAPTQVGSGFHRVAAGWWGFAAVKTDGSLWVWPDAGSPSPVQVGTGFTAVAAGVDHHLALGADGSLWAWGSNEHGQLADGTRVSRDQPTRVGSGYRSIAAGYSSTLLIDNQGRLSGWGLAFQPASVPPSATALGSDFAAASIGWGHVLALKTDGALLTWGNNSDGQLGDRTQDSRLSFTQIGSGYSTIGAGGYFSVASRPSGELFAWGSNAQGQLGIASTTRALPVAVPGSFVKVYAGQDHTLAIDRDHRLWAWGSNDYGQLGIGSTQGRSLPVLVGEGFAAAAAGEKHSLGLKLDGSLWALGGGTDRGQLAVDGTSVCRGETCLLSPQPIGSGYAAVAAGGERSLAIKTDGTLWAWGWNVDGQLGNGGEGAAQLCECNRQPVLIGEGYRAVSTAGGFRTGHTLAIKTDGSLWAWGSNASGELGDGTTLPRSRPQRIGSDFTTVAAGGAFTRGHSVALKADGSIWTWGDNRFGQLGDGTTNNGLRPRQVADGPTLAIAAGDAHTLAIRGDGLVWAWGSSFQGQLGNGGFATAVTATNVVGAGGSDYFDVLPGTANLAINLRLPYFLAMEKAVDGLRSTLTDPRAAGLTGDIYFTALLPGDSPLLGASAANSGLAAARPLRAAGAPRAARAPVPAKGLLPLVAAARPGARALDGAPAMVIGTLTRSGFKQTGGSAASVAETAYSGPLAQSGTLDLYRGLAGDPLADSRALICMGVTVGDLSAKGQVLMRPVVGGNASDGVAQCAPVQTPETTRRFRSEASGPVTARTLRALIDPYAEERGIVRRIFSWAVAPDGRQYMQTAPDQWEPMSEPMRPAATLTVPLSGPVVLDVTRDLDLSGLVGTLVFIGIGESWDSVRSLNTAGHHHTVR